MRLFSLWPPRRSTSSTPLSSAAGSASQKCRNAFFLEADVHEHGLEAVLDVLHPAFENAADDVAVGLALDGVFLELAVLEQRDAPLELLAVDDELDARGFGSQSQNAFYFFDHKLPLSSEVLFFRPKMENAAFARAAAAFPVWFWWVCSDGKIFQKYCAGPAARLARDARAPRPCAVTPCPARPRPPGCQAARTPASSPPRICAQAFPCCRRFLPQFPRQAPHFHSSPARQNQSSLLQG